MKKGLTKYADGAIVRLLNRRVVVKVEPDDSFLIQFVRLSENSNPAVISEFERGKLTTTISLTKEATNALFACLLEIYGIHIK